MEGSARVLSLQDRVELRVLIRPLQGFPLSHGPFDEMRYVQVITVREGQIVSFRDYWSPVMAAEAGLPAGFAASLASMDAQIRAGVEDRTTSAVEDLTGRPPRPFRDFARDHRAAWVASRV